MEFLEDNINNSVASVANEVTSNINDKINESIKKY